MDNFIVSARKYRPETFTSVVGQNSITLTLKNAIRNSHLGHAYLFCGPRGVGKTTCARIFAKTINCSNPSADTEPCNECESCKSFNETRSYNIHELDAASNNSVEDIRLLTEQVRIPPQLGKFSVYIIDEVHMLSASAFNAFLKTLEEPPAHAVFILATTEKHKIIPTILSRCQIFDFNRIRVDDTIKYLEYIAKSEGIAYETEALHIIAQKADGAMRDALSIFDQIVSFSGNEIKYQAVIDNLNILDYEYYFKMTDFLLEAQVSNCLLSLDEVISKGFDGQNFINGLAKHLRDLLVSKNAETVKLLEVSENLRSNYAAQAEKCPVDFLYAALEICNETDYHYKGSRNQRLLVELALLKMTDRNGLKKKSLKSEEDNIIYSVLQSSPETAPAPQKAPSVTAAPVRKEEGQPQAIIDQPSAKPVDNERHSRKNVVPGHNISIRDVISGKTAVAEETPVQSEPESETATDEEQIQKSEEVFDQDRLTEVWKNFADSIKADRPRMTITLKSKPPVLNPGWKVEFPLENTTQVEDFNLNIKPQLLSCLRKELQNDSITVSILIEENIDDSKRKMFTSEEKFQYLAAKNPLLTKLKQQFNLEID